MSKPIVDQGHQTETDFDRRDARTSVLTIISVSVIGVLALMIVGVYFMYVWAYESQDQAVYSGVASQELQAIHAREEEVLHRYSFIDKEKGIVRIPIDRAMEIVAAEAAAGKVFYNTAPSMAKQESPGGALNVPAPAPVADAAKQAATPAAPAASK